MHLFVKHENTFKNVTVLWQPSELRSLNVYVTGCRWEFLAWIENNLDIVGATALAFAILHVCPVHL